MVYQSKTNYLGTLGIDIGPKEITCVHVKNDGNPLKKFSYSIGNLLDKRKSSTKLDLSLIIDKIINYCKEQELSISIEKLKIDNKYRYRNNKLNRMLSKFPYAIFEELIISKTT